ncbi:hypothetical protein PG984_015282 [Apiospora sp. TS-2023a]
MSSPASPADGMTGIRATATKASHDWSLSGPWNSSLHGTIASAVAELEVGLPSAVAFNSHGGQHTLQSA